MKVSVVDQKGKDTGRQVDLSKDVFGVDPHEHALYLDCLLYTSPSPRDRTRSRMPSSA